MYVCMCIGTCTLSQCGFYVLLAVSPKGGKKGAHQERPVDISRLDIRVGVVVSAEKVHTCIIIGYYIHTVTKVCVCFCRSIQIQESVLSTLRRLT